jgi:hypothetical protein
MPWAKQSWSRLPRSPRWVECGAHDLGCVADQVAGAQSPLLPVLVGSSSLSRRRKTCEVGTSRNVSADMLSARVCFERQAVLNFPRSSIAFRPLTSNESRSRPLVGGLGHKRIEATARSYRWLYSFNGGKTAYFQRGKYRYYAKTSQWEYYQNGDYIYPTAGGTGRPVLYVRDKNVYSMDGIGPPLSRLKNRGPRRQEFVHEYLTAS